MSIVAEVIAAERVRHGDTAADLLQEIYSLRADLQNHVFWTKATGVLKARVKELESRLKVLRLPKWLEELGSRITQLLADDPRPPVTKLGLPFWMARNLYTSDFPVLETAEQVHGEAWCSQWLCELMAASGRYTTDGEYVETA